MTVRRTVKVARVGPAFIYAFYLVALTIAYVVVARLSLTVAFVHGTVSPVWPPTGLAIAALTLWGPRLWPVVAVGTITANLLIGDPPLVTAGIAVGNTLEAVFGALALRRLGVRGEVARVRDAVAILTIAVLAPLPSATGGVLSLTLAGFSAWDRYPWVWLVWWVGNVMGALIVMPLMLAWVGARSSVPLPARPAEFAGVLALTVASVSVVFLRADALAVLDVDRLPLGAFLFPPMVWAVLRLRPRETTLVIAVVAILAVAYTVGLDPALTERETIGPLLWTQMVLFSLGGGFLLLIGALTERAQAQQMLRANEIRFRTIFEQAAVGIAQVAREGRLLEVNNRLCEMLGYGRDELLTKTFEDITDSAFVAAERRQLADMRAGRRMSYVIEKRYRRKDGSVVWVRVTSSRGDDADAEAAYRISIVEDITRQKEAMTALQAAKAHLEFALEGARASLWEWNIQADHVAWSDEHYRLTGLDRGTPPTLDAWLAMLVPEDRERASQVVRTTVERKETSFQLEFRVHHPDMGVRWLMGIGRVSYGEDGTPLRMVGLNVDVTDLKRAEEEARAAKNAAERANRAKSRFLAAASHDLRQPVQAMVLLNTVLSSRLKDHPTSAMVANMGASLNALQRLLAALLDISRLDAGVVVPDIQATPVGGIIERLGAEYSLHAAQRDLSLRIVVSSAWTRTDPTLLERILRNLIENALRYTERGKILVGCRRRGGVVRVHVIDTGIGIPRNHQEGIFQEFYQVGNPERDREKGLGLGLSIVSRLCGLLGHRLSVVSEPGRGSCFMVDIPLARPEGDLLDRRPEAGVWQGGWVILVIDDEALVRQSLAQVLEDWGCVVLLAADASEAVGCVGGRGRCPDIILADYRLPGGRTGIDAAKAVHLACGRPIPAIILTGDTAPDRIAEAQASGFRLMHKPVVPETLREAISALRP